MNFLDFLDFWNLFEIFCIFFGFFWFFGIPFKVTNVTTKGYQGYYWTPKMAKNGPKHHNKLFFCPNGKKTSAEALPQELEVGPRSRLYLLVYYNILTISIYWLGMTIIYVNKPEVTDDTQLIEHIL